MRVTQVVSGAGGMLYGALCCFTCGSVSDRGVFVLSYSEHEILSLREGSYLVLDGLVHFIGVCSEHEGHALLLNMGEEGDVDMSDDVIEISESAWYA